MKKKLYLPENLFPKKNFFSPFFFLSKNICHQKTFAAKKNCQPKLSLLKTFFHQKTFCTTFFFTQKHLFAKKISPKDQTTFFTKHFFSHKKTFFLH